MAEKNEVAKKQEFTTGLSQWTNTIAGLVSRDFEQNGVQYDGYSKRCAMNAMSAIYQLVQNTDKADMNNLNTSNLREVVAQCASLKLNANAMPREVFFQLRSKQVGGQWVKMVEMGVEGDGNDALLRQFGNNVDTVYPVWLVKEGDDFTYPRRRGIEIEPAEWTPKGLSDKTVRVVYPVKLKDGTIDYLIAEREPVKTNLIAHIRNNLMNETFGICENRYKATDKQKAEIKAKKEEILSVFRACETVDDMKEWEQKCREMEVKVQEDIERLKNLTIGIDRLIADCTDLEDKMILEYVKDGKSQQQIAMEIGLDQSVVSRRIKKYVPE